MAVKLVKLFDKATYLAPDEKIIKFWKDETGKWDLVETDRTVYDLEALQ